MTDKKMNKKALVAMSVAGLMTAASLVAGSSSAYAMGAGSGEYESCYGVNACKAMGACGGQDHACGGKNACKGAGWVQVAKGTCTKIENGRLTA